MLSTEQNMAHPRGNQVVVILRNSDLCRTPLRVFRKFRALEPALYGDLCKVLFVKVLVRTPPYYLINTPRPPETFVF